VKLNIVPARTGILWVKLGVQTFLKQPLALTGLFFMYMAAVLLLTQLPFVGQLLAAMLVPAATLGLMAATAEAASGRFPMPTVLVSAFRAGKQRGRAMLVLGLIYMIGSVLATQLGKLVAGDPAAGDAQNPQIDPAMVVVLLLHSPLVVLFWHAPALVHWHGVSPVKSLFFSAIAVFRNIGAMLVYGFTWMVVFLLVGFVFSTIGMLLGGVAVARTVMMPTVLLLVTMFSTSLYFTFRDSFQSTAESPAPPTTAP
jgi:hypothetical protein